MSSFIVAVFKYLELEVDLINRVFEASSEVLLNPGEERLSKEESRNPEHIWLSISYPFLKCF
jgi:ABC-type Zn uptake system ZnuABC Zn-binding protein ZnuA